MFKKIDLNRFFQYFKQTYELKFQFTIIHHHVKGNCYAEKQLFYQRTKVLQRKIEQKLRPCQILKTKN